MPETRTCFVKLADCEILDTWYTTELPGTGSNDIAIHDVLVPTEQTFTFQDRDLVKRQGPLYAFPLMFIAKGAPPALGIARHAIDILIENAERRPARRDDAGRPCGTAQDAARRSLRAGRGATQRRRYWVRLAPTFSTLSAICGRPWWRANGRAHGNRRVSSRRTATWSEDAWKRCRRCSRDGRFGGISERPLDRCLRDVVTMNQHLMGSLKTYEMAGRLLMGLEPLRWML